MSLLARKFRTTFFNVLDRYSPPNTSRRYVSTRISPCKPLPPPGRPLRCHRQYNKHLKKFGPQNNSKSIPKSIDVSGSATSHRYSYYTRTLSALLRGKKLQTAALLYARMIHEGFLPSFALQAVMQVLKCIASSPSEDMLLETFEQIFASGKGNQYGLRRSLNLLCHLIRIRPEILDSIVLTFLRTREPGYVLSDATKVFIADRHRRVDAWEHARRWISSLSDGAQEQKLLSTPSKANLETLQKSVKLTTGSLNTFLATQFAYRLNGAGFNTYREWRKTYPHILPNSLTYMMLFRAVSQYNMTRPRSLHNRRYKRIPGLPSARQIFRDLIHTHYLGKYPHLIPPPESPSSSTASSPSSSPRSSPPPAPSYTKTRNGPSIMSPEVLTAALKTFVTTRDYAGAFLCLRTITLEKLSITLPTYRVILGPIVRRIQRDLPWFHQSADPRIYWGYRFLGHPPLPFDFDVHLLESVLRLGEQREIGLIPYTPILAYGLGHETVDLPTRDSTMTNLTTNYALEDTPFSDLPTTTTRITPSMKPQEETNRLPNIPSALEIIGLQEPSRREWDVVPLFRILRRAILASVLEFQTLPAKEVSQALVSAKETMIPPEVVALSSRQKSAKGRKSSRGLRD